MPTRPTGDLPERGEARSRLSIGTWWVAEDYRLKGGIVRPMVGGGPMRCDDLGDLSEPAWYSPMGRAELPAELAKVADEREESLLAFVRRYGLLGQLQAVRAQGPLVLPRPETPPGASAVAVVRRLVAQMVVDHRSDRRALWEATLGDSTAWFFAHARTVRLVQELTHALLDSDERLAAVMSRIKDSHGNFRVLSAYGADYGAMQLSGQYLGATRQEQARLLIVNLINPNLRLTRSGLYVDLDGEEISHAIEASGLVGYVYRHLADAVVSRRLRQCAYGRCRRLFVATDERMKYCPPPLGVLGVSPCMNRSKVAEARARKRLRQRPQATGGTARKKGGKR